VPMPDPRPLQTDALKQIQAAWQEAQANLQLLREQVELASNMAQAKVQSNVYERDLDRAYRDLGEAVWAEVSKGKLQLPSTLSQVKKALESVTVKIQQQNASINDLLAEGEDIAKKLHQKMVAASKGVASQQKKR
jgi:hypothetical protein